MFEASYSNCDTQRELSDSSFFKCVFFRFKLSHCLRRSSYDVQAIVLHDDLEIEKVKVISKGKGQGHWERLRSNINGEGH
jgi:hypothetical protein